MFDSCFQDCCDRTKEWDDDEVPEKSKKTAASLGARKSGDGSCAKEKGAHHVDKLLLQHYIFEAYEAAAEYVEEREHLNEFRDLAHIMTGGLKLPWGKKHEGKIGGSAFTYQYLYGGAQLGEEGTDYMWFKLCLDQEVPWWKLFGSWHEPEWNVKIESKRSSNLKAAYMVGDSHPTHAIRCQIGRANPLVRYTQDYLEVHRYINKETGFCIERNVSVDHDELAKRGLDVGKAEYDKGGDTMAYILSFPRSETQCTGIFLMRWKPNNTPKWLIDLGTVFAPTLARVVLPQMQADLEDSDLDALMVADKLGIHAYLQDFAQKALDAGVGKYDALNLPPAEAVLGRWKGSIERRKLDVVRRSSRVSNVVAANRRSRPISRMLGKICSCIC